MVSAADPLRSLISVFIDIGLHIMEWGGRSVGIFRLRAKSQFFFCLYNGLDSYGPE
jgi:hypothetical protein